MTNYYSMTENFCCESKDCEDECVCEEKHSDCSVCQTTCGCMCDELYESWKDSQFDNFE